MKYCTKCGYQLVDTARFCNYCGAPITTPAETPAVKGEDEFHQNPYAEASQSCQQPQNHNCQYTSPKTDEELLKEEQDFLNRIHIGLKHEALAWRIGATVHMVYAVLVILLGLFDAGDEVECVTNLVTGILYLSISIVGFVTAGKVSRCRNILHIDCKSAIRHYTPGSIVLGALFNSIAMIFVIVYFVQVKSNAAVIERIKTKQEEYNSQR